MWLFTGISAGVKKAPFGTEKAPFGTKGTGFIGDVTKKGRSLTPVFPSSSIASGCTASIARRSQGTREFCDLRAGEVCIDDKICDLRAAGPAPFQLRHPNSSSVFSCDGLS